MILLAFPLNIPNTLPNVLPLISIILIWLYIFSIVTSSSISAKRPPILLSWLPNVLDKSNVASWTAILLIFDFPVIDPATNPIFDGLLVLFVFIVIL